MSATVIDVEHIGKRYTLGEDKPKLDLGSLFSRAPRG